MASLLSHHHHQHRRRRRRRRRHHHHRLYPFSYCWLFVDSRENQARAALPRINADLCFAEVAKRILHSLVENSIYSSIMTVIKSKFQVT